MKEPVVNEPMVKADEAWVNTDEAGAETRVKAAGEAGAETWVQSRRRSRRRYALRPKPGSSRK